MTSCCLRSRLPDEQEIKTMKMFFQEIILHLLKILFQTRKIRYNLKTITFILFYDEIINKKAK